MPTSQKGSRIGERSAAGPANVLSRTLSLIFLNEQLHRQLMSHSEKWGAIKFLVFGVRQVVCEAVRVKICFERGRITGRERAGDRPLRIAGPRR